MYPGHISRSSSDLRSHAARTHSRTPSMDLRHSRNSSADLNKFIKNEINVLNNVGPPGMSSKCIACSDACHKYTWYHNSLLWSYNNLLSFIVMIIPYISHHCPFYFSEFRFQNFGIDQVYWLRFFFLTYELRPYKIGRMWLLFCAWSWLLLLNYSWGHTKELCRKGLVLQHY